MDLIIKANEVRLAHRISVSGDDIPDAITSFSDVKERYSDTN